MLRLVVFLLGIAMLLPGDLFAEVIERGKESVSGGRDFLISIPPIDAMPTEKPLPQPVILTVSAQTATRIWISAQGDEGTTGIEHQFDLDADETIRIPIYGNYQTVEPGVIDQRVIRVTSVQLVTVSVYLQWMGNGELMQIYPQGSGWGRRFRTIHSFQDEFDHVGEPRYGVAHASVVAATDSTEVMVRTQNRLVPGPDLTETAPGEYRAVLDSGERIYLKWAPQEGASGAWSTDATGTLIESSMPVAVYSGMTKVAIMRMPERLPLTGQFSAEAHFVRNSLLEMVLPERIADTSFITVPVQYTPVRSFSVNSAQGMDPLEGDVIRVVALEDETVVSVKRLDGDGWITLANLQAGESYLDTAETNVRVWRTSRPAQMYQYGKSYAKLLASRAATGRDASQGHPTVEAGMPMLMSVPGIDRMVSTGIFHAFSGMDNFVTIVFRFADAENILVDGKPLPEALKSSIQTIDGTEFGFIRSSIGAGDHVIGSVSDDVRWMAWTYGSLDGLAQGRAYGTPVAVSLASACDDALDVTERVDCHIMSGTVGLAGSDSCSSIIAIVPETLENAEVVSTGPLDDDSMGWTVRAIDESKDARVVVFAQSSSGAFVRVEQQTQGELVYLEPERIELGMLPTNDDACSTITVRNLSEKVVTITSIRARMYGDSIRVTTPLPISLAVNEAATIEFCVRPWTALAIRDTLIWSSSCGEVGSTPIAFRWDSATSVLELTPFDGRLMPLPFSLSTHASLRIDLAKPPSQITIMDIQGSEVYQLSINTQTAFIHVPASAFPTPGWYGVILDWKGARQHLPLLVTE